MTGEQRKELKQYEQVIEELRGNLKYYKKQDEELRQDIQTVVADNNRFSLKVRRADNFHQFNEENINCIEDGRGEQYLDDIVQELKDQIRTLTEENQRLNQNWNLSKNTIRELGKEITSFSCSPRMSSFSATISSWRSAASSANYTASCIFFNASLSRSKHSSVQSVRRASSAFSRSFSKRKAAMSLSLPESNCSVSDSSVPCEIIN